MLAAIVALSILGVVLAAGLAFDIGRRLSVSAPSSGSSRPFNLITFLDGYKTYLSIAASVVYGVGIDYGWWHHSLTLDTLLGGSVVAAFRSGMKTGNAQIVNAVANTASIAKVDE